MPRTRARTHGFSLIELITVMSIVIVLGSLALPVITSMGRAREFAAARTLARDLDIARDRALLTGRATFVVFSPSAEEYAVLEEPTTEAGRSAARPVVDPARRAAWTVRFVGPEWGVVDLSTVSVPGTSAPELRFDGKGRPTTSAGAPLGSGARVEFLGGTRVTVEPRTGLSRVRGSGT
ncbi:MAG: type II secretion system protein [Phycisphaerales bacterium]